jgi:hypothetical protein
MIEICSYCKKEMEKCECCRSHKLEDGKTPVAPNYDDVKDLYSYGFKINEEILEYSLNDNNKERK